MERSNYQSMKETLTEMGVLIRRFQEAYFQRKESQPNIENVTDHLEPKSQEEEQHVGNRPDNMERQDFVKQEGNDQENEKKRELKDDTTYSGGTQQTQEDMDYIMGSNDWKYSLGDEKRASNQYYWREEWENGIEDYTKFLKKRREKRKKIRERGFKTTRKKKRKKNREVEIKGMKG